MNIIFRIIIALIFVASILAAIGGNTLVGIYLLLLIITVLLQEILSNKEK